MFVEKRKFARLSFLADVAYIKKDTVSTVEDEKKSVTKNISEGGICLVTQEELKVSDVLELKIFVPEEKIKRVKLFGVFPLVIKTLFPRNKIAINVLGKVAWIKKFSGEKSQSEKFEVGIEFVNISDTDREKIDKYVLKTSQA